MASGVAVDDSVVQTWSDIKMNHNLSYFIMKINDDKTAIVVEDTCAKGQGSYNDLREKLIATTCRYAVVDFEYTLADGGQRSKLVFITWCPDSSSIKDKMMYASSKDALKKKLNGLQNEVQATDEDELDEDDIQNKISGGGTR
jgi:cofilin